MTKLNPLQIANKILELEEEIAEMRCDDHRDSDYQDRLSERIQEKEKEIKKLEGQL
jgi:vacuolar-type H+-ATPase subunit I/STV1